DDVTLYANWSAIPYNITYYNLTGATNPKTNPITYNVTSVITLDNASKMGYTFEGWYNSTEFTEENKTNTIPKGSFGDKVFYANWTVNSTTGTVIDNKAEFGNNNITAINSTSGGIVTKVLLENVSKVKNDKNVVFTAANTTLHIPDYDRNTTDKEITVFEIISSVVDSSGYALITVKVTFNDEENATINENKILFSHYNTTIKEWDKTPLVRASYRNGKNVTYVVQTKSFSPFGVGIYTPIVDPSPSSGGGSSKQTGSTVILQDGVITPTIAPTDAPTVKPTGKTGTSTIIATEKPTTQPTQQSPAPALGILAGFGAAALVLTRMKR
ncbi:MAG TPA: InlB B-repeat-containing protein, partial [Methanocorpusculum sp.]|nr:InlB B-repeat-containing protein [Methanocorpusculum sp.]